MDNTLFNRYALALLSVAKEGAMLQQILKRVIDI